VIAMFHVVNEQDMYVYTFVQIHFDKKSMEAHALSKVYRVPRDASTHPYFLFLSSL